MSELEELRNDVDSLMRRSDKYGIIIDGFWEQFEKVHGYKPDPKYFGKSRLIALFDLFPNLVKERKKHAKRPNSFATYVCLKKSTKEKDDRGRSSRVSESSHKVSLGKNPKQPDQVIERGSVDRGEQSRTSTSSKEKDRKHDIVKQKTGDNRFCSPASNVEKVLSPVESKQKKEGKSKNPALNDTTGAIPKDGSKGAKKQQTEVTKKAKSCAVPKDANKGTKNQQAEVFKKLDKPTKDEDTMSRHPKPLKEMEGQGYIFHTYGRNRSSSGERGGQSSTEYPQEQSRLPLWLRGNDGGQRPEHRGTEPNPPVVYNLFGSQQSPPLPLGFQQGGYGMMPAATPVAAAGTPLVYGMNFPSLSDVSAVLSQARSSGGKSAKQLQKQQKQNNAQSEAFISLDSPREERSNIAPPPPPKQYKEPPSASAIGAAATSEAREWDGPSSSRSMRTMHQQSSGRKGRNTVYVSKQELESVAADCIERLSEAEEYVSAERIEQLVLRHYEAETLEEINVRRIEHIKCVGELIRVQCKVNAYIQSFCKTRSIGTLHDLHLNLQDFCASAQQFETLKLGPLKKLPIVWEYFKLPEDGDILEITTVDIFDNLRNFLTEKELWQSRDLKKELEPFMMYLVERYRVPSPYYLGVRISSMLLAVQVLKKSQRDAGQAIRSACDQFKNLAQEDIATAFRSFTSSFLEKETGMCTVRQNLIHQDSIQVFGALFSKLIMLYDSISYSPFMVMNTQPGVRKDWNKTRDIINQFHSRLTKDKFMKKIFHFCICTPMEQIHEQLQDIMGWNPSAQSAEGEETVQERPLPHLGDVVNLVKKYLERCMMHGALSLGHLARIENKLLEEFNFPTFHAMGQGHFIDFLLTCEEIKQFLEESGGGLMGLSSGSAAVESSFHPGFQDILEFMCQCALSDPHQTAEVEEALCSHYQVSEVKCLGHGSIQTLIHAMNKQPRGSSRDTSVVYEAAVSSKARIPSVKQRKVGIMGSQSKEKAFAALENCPLLEDMGEWTHWDLVFKPELGSLKDFVQRYGGTRTHSVSGLTGKVTMTTSFLALETSPGKLLKITADTSNDKFAQAAANANVGALCGHLVSLVVLNKGPERTPLALLGNHVQTALLKINAADTSSEVPGAPTAKDKPQHAVMFVLGCLTYLPFIICQAVANQVFLEPLSHVIGATKSKELLLSCSTSNVKMHGRLQLLGSMLGIDEWARTFQTRTAVADECIQKPERLDVPGFAENEIIELDSSDECEEVASDDEEDFTLSEDSDEETMEQTVPRSQNKDEENKPPEKPITDKKEEKRAEEIIEIKESDIESEKTETIDESSEMEIEEVVIPVDPHEALIEEIRKEEFGINVELSEDGRKLMNKQKERLGRSLDRLSKDLYSKDTHFVLELIQNADDNGYSDEVTSSGSGPAVKFLVDDKCITVLNNEYGFKEQNIRAICDVGKSTKGKHKYGYIGQKGIGFKSVFRITDTPEIHSNDYHIRFDVKSDPMGYILPHWHPETADKSTSDRWTTKIVLPLKEDMQSSAHASSLAARFQDVHPSLLLFLHRLKAITVVNKVEERTLKMQRRDIGDNVIEIKHSGGFDRWLVVKKTLDASHISIKAKSGVDVESTEIALAFPLQSKEKVQTRVLPQKQPVFAFLPLRSYGFRFVIQADFDVPSSREDVDRDSMWNQWLVSEIHTLFVESIETFKAHPDFSVFDAVCNFLQFIPLEDEILEFFRTVASQILQQLRGKPCFPTQPNTQGKVDWKLPSQLVLATDPLVKEVVSGTILQQHLSLTYLNDKVANSASATLLKNLGVQTLSTQHLIEVAKGIIQTGGLANADITMIAKWWACVYRSMDELQLNEEIRTQLRDLAIIPLVDGHIVSLQECSVFFPLDQEERRKKLKKGKDPLLALERDLNTVHPLLMNTDDQIANSQAAKLLEQLGVKKLTPSDVIKHHILPVLKEEHPWKNKSEDLLVAYMVYIKEQFDKQPAIISIEEFKNLAVIRTNKGMCKPCETSIHFSMKYNNSKIGLERNFPGYPWTLVDDCYIQGLFSVVHINTWHAFFLKLGVLDFLAIDEKTVSFNVDQIERTPWSAYNALIPTSATSVQVRDFSCPQFEALVKDNTYQQNIYHQMRALFETLEKEWKDKYARCVTTQMLDGAGNFIRDVDSSFAVNLKTLSWLPGIEMQCTADPNGLVIFRQENVLDIPKKMFIRAPIMEKMLAHHVTYLNAQMAPQSDLGTFIGINQVINIAFMKECIIKWSTRTEENPDEPARFITSLRHIKDVYKHLQENLPPKQLQDLLHDHSAIFYPCTPDAAANPDSLIEGKFLGRNNVRWHDQTGLFSKYRKSLMDHQISDLCRFNLRGIYADMEDFFTRAARIDNQPTLPEIITLLKHIVNTNTVQKALPDVLQIFSIIGTKMIESDQMSRVESDLTRGRIKEQVAKLRDLEVIPTKANKWVPVSSQPMVADDKAMERLFKSNPEVSFVDTGDKLKRFTGPKRQQIPRFQAQEAKHDPEAVTVFLELCGIKLLSDCLRTDYITESYQPCAPLQQYVHDVVPYIQKELYNSHTDIHDVLKAMNIKGILENMLFVSVGKLDVVYELKHKPDVMAKLPEKCKLKDNSEFYIQKDHVDHREIKSAAFTDVNKELAKFFSQGSQECFSELRNFLLEIMPLILNKSKELHELEYGFLKAFTPEEEWHVKEPVWYKAPSPPPLPPVEEPMETDRPPSRQGTANEGGDGNLVKAWPPASLALDNPDAKKASSSKSIWPPPEPPNRVDTSLLPANIRPARPDLPGRPRSPSDPQKQPQTDKRLYGEGSNRSSDDTTPKHGFQPAYQSILNLMSSESTCTTTRTRKQTDDKVDPSRVTAKSDGSGRRSPSSFSTTSTSDGHTRDGGRLGGHSRGESATGEKGQRSHEGGMSRSSGVPDVQIVEQKSAHRDQRHDGGQQDVIVIDDDQEGTIPDQINLVVTDDDDWEQSKFKKPQPPEYRRRLSLILPKKRQRVESDSSVASGNDEQRRYNFVYDVPAWTADATDQAYEEIGTGSNLPAPQNMTLDAKVDQPEIGRWGEMLVHNYLIQQQEVSDASILEVKWVNEAEETGSPYDFLVKIRDPENSSEIIEIYIEVKATKSNKKSFFEISAQEVKFAQEKQEYYHLYRVFNAGDSSKVRLTRLENLAYKMDSQQVRLCLAV